MPVAPTLPTPSAPTPAPAAAPTSLDPNVVNLAKAIRTTETQGQTDPFSAKGASGEWGAYQFTPDTWNKLAPQFGVTSKFGQASPSDQNKVAYNYILSLKNQGHNPAQIASIWNSGKPDWQGNVGTNKFGVKYDTPQYVKSVYSTYQALKGGQQNPTIQPTSSTVGNTQFGTPPAPTPDEQNAQQTGALFPANVGQDSVLSTVGKTLGNLPGSAFNFVKGAINTLNPLTIASNIGKIGQGLGQISQMPGGIGGYIKQLPGGLASAAYQTLVPQAGRDVISGIGNLATGNTNAAGTNFESAQRNVVNDPFGQVAPFVLGAQGLAEGLDKVGATENASGAVDNAISKTGQLVTKPIGAVAGKVAGFAGDVLGGAGKFTASQLTGLEPGTIKTIAENPEQFSKQNMATIDRSSLGQTVQSALGKRIADLKDTGEAYAPIRNSDTVVKVSPNLLEDTIKETTGLDLAKTPTETPKGGLPTIDESGAPATEPGGKWQSSAAAKLRDATDVRAVQNFYNKYQPLFDKGEMTTNEFLNMRSDLADLSKFERQIGKSKPVEAATQIIRGKLNTALRPQIEGLATLDSSFAGQSSELKTLSKGLVDKNGQLTDSAINKIANATGKGKDAVIARLEEISPGITKKIQILKAVEDVQHASGNKVGTYARGIGMAGLGGGIITGNIPLMAGSIAEMILANPENATSIIRKYGQSAPLISAVVAKLKSAGSAINNAPTTLVAPLSLSGSKP